MNQSLRVFAALGVVYLAWGSSYLAIRLGVHDLPPLLFCALRFLVAAPLLFGLAVLQGERRPAGRRDWLILAATAVLMLLLGSAMVAWAVQWVPSGQAALIIASSALWLAWFGSWGPRGDAIGASTWLGLLSGMAGVALVVSAARASGSAPSLAYLVLLLAAIGWSGGSVVLRRHPVRCGPTMTAAAHMAISSVLLLVLSASAGERLPAWTPRALGALAWLSLFGTVIAYAAYYWLLQHAPPALTSTYACVTPVIAMLLGVVVLDEALTSTLVVGSTMVLASVLIVGRSTRCTG